jgi:hypothetical protein
VRGAGQRQPHLRQPAASAAPLSTSGRACIIFIALRGRIVRAGIAPACDQPRVVMPDRDMAAVHAFDKRVRE